MMRSKLQLSRQTGLSLVELMVSLVISTMIMAGVLQIFVSSKKSYSTEEALSRMQENARFAVGAVSEDIRLTGFAGCSGVSTTPIVPDIGVKDDDVHPVTNFINERSVVGFDEVSGVIDVNGNNYSLNGLVGDTDAFSISTAGTCSSHLMESMSTRTADITVSNQNSCGWTAGQYLIITDCTALDVFMLSNNPSTTDKTATLKHADSHNKKAKLSTKYVSESVVFDFITTTYYIGRNADLEPGLYRKVNNEAGELVVGGVEDMQVRYGIDSDDDFIVDEYKTAAEVGSVSTGDWDKIISIEVNMLMASEQDNLVPQHQVYNFNGSTVTASDNKIRHVVTKNISMRSLSL